MEAAGAEFRLSGASVDVAGAEFHGMGAPPCGAGAEFHQMGEPPLRMVAEFRQMGAPPFPPATPPFGAGAPPFQPSVPPRRMGDASCERFSDVRVQGGEFCVRSGLLDNGEPRRRVGGQMSVEWPCQVAGIGSALGTFTLYHLCTDSCSRCCLWDFVFPLARRRA